MILQTKIGHMRTREEGDGAKFVDVLYGWPNRRLHFMDCNLRHKIHKTWYVLLLLLLILYLFAILRCILFNFTSQSKNDIMGGSTGACLDKTL